MSLFTIALPATAKTLVHDGIDSIVVEATDSAAALVLAKAARANDKDSVWDNATITEVPQDLEGLVFDVTYATGPVISYTAIAADTWEDVGAALAALFVTAGTVATYVTDTVNGVAGTLIVALGNAIRAIVGTPAIVAGGTGYTAADTLTVVGGTSSTAATITVDTVSGGVVTGITVLDAGAYSVLPANPVGVTGGTGGNDATFTVAWTPADNKGDKAITATVVDAAANDVTAEHFSNEVESGVATANLSLDILSGGSSERVIGEYSS